VVAVLKKLTFDNEEKILDFFRTTQPLYLNLSKNEDIEPLVIVHSEEEKANWINSSGENEPPPDFYNLSRKYMLEVMRFDDNASKKGKINLRLARETEMIRELQKHDIRKMFPNVEQILTIADTQLPTHEDHNFTRYRENFIRIIGKHSDKVANYRENHPGYKLIFFIFDESSGIYYRMKSKESPFLIQPYYFWEDEVLVNKILKSGSDYVIWFKPYSYFGKVVDGDTFELPNMIVFDVNNFAGNKITYDETLIFSSEL
jgi:hypothetical protein